MLHARLPAGSLLVLLAAKEVKSICTEEVLQVKLLQQPSVRLINSVAIKNAALTRISVQARDGKRERGGESVRESLHSKTYQHY